MDKTGTIIIVEDDKDDQEVFEEILRSLNHPNEIKFFDSGLNAYEYLANTGDTPFLIISDINLPKLSGFELRDKVYNNEQLRLKCIPYLFFTTSINHRDVIDAYSKSVQGFFIKPNSTSDLKRILSNIINYWQDCTSPNYIK